MNPNIIFSRKKTKDSNLIRRYDRGKAKLNCHADSAKLHRAAKTSLTKGGRSSRVTRVVIGTAPHKVAWQLLISFPNVAVPQILKSMVAFSNLE